MGIEGVASTECRYLDVFAERSELRRVLVGMPESGRVLRAEVGDGTTTDVAVSCSEAVAELSLVRDGAPASTAEFVAPRMALMRLLNQQTALVEWALDWLAGVVEDVRLAHLLPEQRVLCLGHPLLLQLARTGSDVPNAIPVGIRDVYAARTVADAVCALVGPEGSSAASRRAFADLLTASRGSAFRAVSVARAAVGLAPDDVATVLGAADVSLEGGLLVPPAAARASARRWLPVLGRRKWRDLLVACQGHERGVRVLRLLGALEPSMLDGVDVADTAWLHARVAEAVDFLFEDAAPGDGHLHGRPIPGTRLRVRVVSSGKEFRHLGKAMQNCLATYGPAAVQQGRRFLVLVDVAGAPRHALELDGNRVVQWQGPGNLPPARTDVPQVVHTLSRNGIDIDIDNAVAGPPF